MSSKYLETLKSINARIDDVERLLQLLLVNELVDDAENVVKTSEDSVEAAVGDTILRFDLVLKGYKTFNDIKVILLEVPERIRISIKEIKQICIIVKQVYPDVEPLFIYSKINGMQRKSLIQANISFGVKGVELHISKWGKRE